MFVSCNGREKNMVGRSEYIFLNYSFVQIWSQEDQKNLRVGIFLNKNLLG